MRKAVFFVFGLLLGIMLLVWADGYSSLSKDKRYGFFNYIESDIKVKLKQGKKNLKSLNDMISSISSGQGSTYDFLFSQIKKSIESHYLINGRYPDSLKSVLDESSLPKDIKLEYKAYSDSYILKVYSNDGSLIKDLSNR